MAEATSAAPLWTIRKTTSRKPKNAATISDVEMTWLPVRARFASKTGQDYDRGAQSSISNYRPGGATEGVAIIFDFADIQIVMPEAPILILLSPPAPSLDAANVARTTDGDPLILGLGLIERTVLAARRAGYGQVFLLGGNWRATAGAAPIADWRRLAATFASSQSAPLIIAPAAILAEADWLERLPSAHIEPAAWTAIPNRIVMLPAASAPDAVDALDEDARDLAAVEGRLSRLFGPPASIPPEIDPMVVETPNDVRAAERRLLRALVKDTDGFMARHVERPISLRISRWLARTAITPNQMSLISIAVGICGGPFFLSPRPLMQTIGALVFLAHSILDGCDGELARLKFQQSRWGGVLDFWGDNVVHTVIFGCMAIGWSLSAGAIWPLWLGAAAVLGTLGSAGFVYWRLMRLKDGGGALFTSVSDAPERPLARLLDAASRRDFIYLVILLALAGRSNWFLVLAAIGAPIYFFLVLLAARPQASLEGAGSRVAPGANR
jgi:1L-myo-inositol 1-phosphate cytidylyltransferase / CDP-L-myo-inositol myo-inositolphosphotransferase